MTNRNLLRRFGILSGCATALMLLPAVAHAAPDDVTIASSVSDHTATVTITNESVAVIGCKLFGLPAGSVANSESKPPFGYVNPVDLGALIPPGATKTVTLEVFTEDGPNGSTYLADGSYDLYWGCTTVPNVDGVEQWGTLAPTGAISTAEPTRLVVPGEAPSTSLPVEPAPSTGPCYDASCLPPDVADVADDLWNEYTSP